MLTLTRRQQVIAALDNVTAVAEVIRELGEVPSGHLYARLMGHVSLADYASSIEVLKHSGLVKEKNYLLRWVGPRL